MIQNQELAQQLFEMLNTGIEAAEYMQQLLEVQKLDIFMQMGEDLYLLVKSLQETANELQEEDMWNFPAATQSIIVSLVRILKYAKESPLKAVQKIEFELVPLLEELRVTFYYWGMVYPDKKRMEQYFRQDIYALSENRYQAEAARTGNYKYELSIIVIAYNKLDYTKQCVEALLKHIPSDISYELILFNHGSTDSTKEYFESIHPHKQVDIAVNGGGFGVVYRVPEGRYVMTVSNDVIVQKNTIQNLYDCVQSDEKIAWAVPATPNISNLQSLHVTHSSVEEAEQFAESNNIPNRRRREQRIRLNNPIDILRGSVLHELRPAYHFQTKNWFSFPDDRLSLLCRRNGYKIYLVKDAYCYHYGSVTLKAENTDRLFLEGRRDFIKLFGIDPWGKGFCYSYGLFQNVQFDKTDPVSVLGINGGMGSNSLKIKEQLKEQVGNDKVSLYNITMQKSFLSDLKGISDKVEYVSDYNALKVVKKQYDYIISEQDDEKKYNVLQHLKWLYQHTKKDGIAFLELKEEVCIEIIKKNSILSNWFEEVQLVKDRSSKMMWMVLSRKKKQ